MPKTAKRDRGDRGKLLPLGDQPRIVRSLRATDKVWERFGKLSDKLGITKADLLDQVVTHWCDCTNAKATLITDMSDIIEALEAALKLPANRGGAIKLVIRDVLEKLHSPPLNRHLHIP